MRPDLTGNEPPRAPCAWRLPGACTRSPWRLCDWRRGSSPSRCRRSAPSTRPLRTPSALCSKTQRRACATRRRCCAPLRGSCWRSRPRVLSRVRVATTACSTRASWSTSRSATSAAASRSSASLGGRLTRRRHSTRRGWSACWRRPRRFAGRFAGTCTGAAWRPRSRRCAAACRTGRWVRLRTCELSRRRTARKARRFSLGSRGPCAASRRC